jgi:hypothetical protein
MEEYKQFLKGGEEIYCKMENKQKVDAIKR